MADSYRKSIDIFVQAHDQASANLSKTTQSVGMVSKALGSLKNIALGYVGFSSLRRMWSFLQDTIDWMDQTGKYADILGTTTEELLRLRYAAEISGSSIQVLDKAFDILVRRTGEATRGSGEAIRGFEMLGISAKEFAKLSPAQMFEEVAEAVKKQKTPAEQAALAYLMFGRQGTQLLNILKLGKDELKRLGDEAESTGGVFSRDIAARAEEAQDAMTRLKWSLRGVGEELSSNLIPKVKDYSDRFSYLLARTKEANENKDFWGMVMKAAISPTGQIGWPWNQPKKTEETDVFNVAENVKVATAMIQQNLELQESAAKLKDTFIDQAQTYGMTARMAQVYRLELQGLGEDEAWLLREQAKALDKMDAQVKAWESQKKVVEDYKKTLQDLYKEFTITAGKMTERDWLKIELAQKGWADDWIREYVKWYDAVEQVKKDKANQDVLGSRGNPAAVESRFLQYSHGITPEIETARNTKSLVDIGKQTQGKIDQLKRAVEANTGTELLPANIGS